MKLLKNNLVVHLIFLCIVVKGLNAEEPEKIVGGIDSIHHPFMAYIKMDEYYACGATIIDDRHLLTAAHCIRPGENNLRIVTGTMNTKKGGVGHRIEKMITHEKYHDCPVGENYDIAVIKLRDPIRFDQFQQPIGLPKSHPPANSMAKVMGWGSVGWPSQYYPTNLQEMDAMILSDKVCDDFGLSGFVDSSIAMCAYAKIGTGMCSGDSGGPLVVNNTLIGIVSRTFPCAKGIPDIYTKVYPFLDFIKKNTKER